MVKSNMFRAVGGALAAVSLSSLVVTAELEAQVPVAGFEDAVSRVQSAWRDHDFARVVASSDSLRLQFPGANRGPALRAAQAASVLAEYLREAEEVSFDFDARRVVSEYHAYAQMERTFVVPGTDDMRVEVVFLGFRYVDDQWRLREIRIRP